MDEAHGEGGSSLQQQSAPWGWRVGRAKAATQEHPVCLVPSAFL